MTKDWKNHKPSCPPYTVREVPGKGRGLFATRKISPGKIILEETPIFTLKNPNKGYPVYRLSDFTQIDDETKATILQLHDPGENLKNLDKKDVDQLIRERPLFSYDSEVGKVARIICNSTISVNETDSTEGGLYYNISFINHSCNPNAIWTRVMGDIKKKQVRALKVIEKDEEILCSYIHTYINQEDPTNVSFETRQTRQQTLVKIRAFLCSCSECSLEGEELQENERIRAEIREKIKTFDSLIPPLPAILHRHNVKQAVKLSQEVITLVKKLNLQEEIAMELLQTALPVAWHARDMGLRGPDPTSIKNEALEMCQKFGYTMMTHYNNISKRYV